ncbi:hypothetical protein HLB44_04170 [Aquincola sp. S2]|uniref:Lipoprotein n=1 Tax=Pseudaquabacterium terrae TaxID=2732868 RepID=A0ABX2EAP4_9BURK|nr:hypothetical protein [Aquabacterium terrae]NRF66171.1 hypothetical protein [Aquabacterium terrae]
MQSTWNGGGLTLATLIAAVLAAGCGGGDSEVTREELVAEAKALRTRAVSQVNAGPCADDSQCTGLVFGMPEPTCTQHDQHTYSKLSPGSAAAEATAAEQRSTARAAMEKTPLTPIACTAHFEAPPRHVCVAQRCEQRAGLVPG